MRRVLRAGPFRDLDNIMALRGIEYAHENYNFIDHWHPSRLGNRIVAEAVFERLSAGDENAADTSSGP
jgi:phospholipase/lecithinase/hemolysin